jgi:flagella basal body P-ring formation protein FlgA
MMRIQLNIFSFLLLSLAVSLRGAPCHADTVSELLKKELSKTYSGARVELGAIQWTRGVRSDPYQSVVFYGDDARGNAHFLLRAGGASGAPTVSSEGWVAFSAWLPAKVALRRIHPGEKLTPDAFVTQQVDVATGLGREYRGVIFPSEAEVTAFESTQTLLEGQFLLGSGVRKIPDIRRGDSVRIQLIAGDLILSTQGIAQEAGYLNGSIRALTTRNKREVSGLLKADGVLEVKL